MLAQMKRTVELLGTTLKLRTGEVVEIYPVSNLPKTSPIKYWARPWGGHWSDGVHRPADGEASIGVSTADLVFH